MTLLVARVVVTLDHDFHDLAEMATIALALDFLLPVEQHLQAPRLLVVGDRVRHVDSRSIWAGRVFECEDGIVLDLFEQWWPYLRGSCSVSAGEADDDVGGHADFASAPRGLDPGNAFEISQSRVYSRDMALKGWRYRAGFCTGRCTWSHRVGKASIA